MESNVIRRLEQHPYVSLQSIGSGGQGSVDLVEDEHGQRFARKTAHGIPQEALQSIANEVAIARWLESRHIIRIRDAYYVQDSTRQHADCAFIMDQIAICNLAQLLNQPQSYSPYFLSSPDLEARTPHSFLLKGLGCMTTALVYAHSRGVRHKDIKPENILIWIDESRRPRLLLTDFGLARDLASRGDANLASHSFNAGTYRYAPPEVLGNNVRDARSDVFSLGCVFAQILAFALPQTPLRSLLPHFFGDGESNATLRATLNSLRNLPFFGGLAILVRRMLNPEKAGRPYAAQVQQTLESIAFNNLFCVHCRAHHAQQRGTKESDGSESDGSDSDGSDSDGNESDAVDQHKQKTNSPAPSSASDLQTSDDGKRMRHLFQNNQALANYIMPQPQFIGLRQMHERNGTDFYGDRRLHDLVIRLQR
ncbi:hypothetical protein KC318_g16220 [Hortaea werneckii]|nr:hypothetical protein KC334_g16309 [Hortaea werneckii]KAI6932145.1 hypothetical protein KC355_g16229 [Hortaea werneckii]KAI7650739.1 hypothetical protein KC318_g16220 [Hortaea werneckii]